MNSTVVKAYEVISVVATLVMALSGCGNDDDGERSGVNPSTFAQLINNGSTDYDDKAGGVLVKDTTRRGDYFVFHDTSTGLYWAIDLAALKRVYPDTEEADHWWRQSNEAADAWTRDHSLAGAEIVTPIGADPQTGESLFVGMTTGLTYEDHGATKDVDLMAAEAEERGLEYKAEALSRKFEMSVDSSTKLVMLGEKVERLLKNRSGELTEADKAAFHGELLGIGGVSLAEVSQAITDSASGNPKSADDVIEKVAANLGTTGANLRDKIMPELLGVHLE